jgi:hypothetical protein
MSTANQTPVPCIQLTLVSGITNNGKFLLPSLGNLREPRAVFYQANQGRSKVSLCAKKSQDRNTAATVPAHAHQEHDVEDMQHILEEHDAVAIRVTRLPGRHLVSCVLPLRHGGPVTKWPRIHYIMQPC